MHLKVQTDRQPVQLYSCGGGDVYSSEDSVSQAVRQPWHSSDCQYAIVCRGASTLGSSSVQCPAADWRQC